MHSRFATFDTALVRTLALPTSIASPTLVDAFVVRAENLSTLAGPVVPCPRHRQEFESITTTPASALQASRLATDLAPYELPRAVGVCSGHDPADGEVWFAE